MSKAQLATWFLIVSCIVGCGTDEPNQAVYVGRHWVSMETVPDPLALGENADIIVTLTDDDQHPATGCDLRLRQHMPGMKMALDSINFPLHDADGKGIYRGKSGEFSMGGDWIVELEFTCRSETYTQAFAYHLAW